MRQCLDETIVEVHAPIEITHPDALILAVGAVVFRIDGRVRFAVGLAAGLILGLALHFVPIWGSKAPVQVPVDRQVAKAPSNVTDRPVSVMPVRQGGAHPTTGEVDWYVITSPTGAGARSQAGRGGDEEIPTSTLLPS